MSFTPAKLSALAHGQSFTLWHYTSIDEPNQLLDSTYLSAASGIVRRGDLIVCSSMSEGTRKTGLVLVTDVQDGQVQTEVFDGGTAGYLTDLADVTSGTAADGDVLTFKGGNWASDTNPGALGDAHAALTGNPHMASAADLGAIPVSEKGTPGGTATLDADGRLSVSQFRASALNELDDVVATPAGAGDILKFDGLAWVATHDVSTSASLTGTEIKALYEAEPDTNGFTSAEKAKLAGYPDPVRTFVYKSAGWSTLDQTFEVFFPSSASLEDQVSVVCKQGDKVVIPATGTDDRFLVQLQLRDSTGKVLTLADTQVTDHIVGDVATWTIQDPGSWAGSKTGGYLSAGLEGLGATDTTLSIANPDAFELTFMFSKAKSSLTDSLTGSVFELCHTTSGLFWAGDQGAYDNLAGNGNIDPRLDYKVIVL